MVAGRQLLYPEGNECVLCPWKALEREKQAYFAVFPGLLIPWIDIPPLIK